MKKTDLYFFILLFQISASILYGQDIIYLNNSSFEGKPHKGGFNSVGIKSWINSGHCQFPYESPPDILPTPDYGWGVSLKAHDGKTYLSLVVRDNASFESISQKLTSPIIGGKCYTFSALLSKSETYKSATSRSENLEDFTQPVDFLIRGGNRKCTQVELLAQTEEVDNTSWLRYKFTLQPKATHTFIFLEAYFSDPPLGVYNGHVLVDYLSPIIEIDCK